MAEGEASYSLCPSSPPWVGAPESTTLSHSGTPWDQLHPHSQAVTNLITFTVLLSKPGYFNINALPN